MRIPRLQKLCLNNIVINFQIFYQQCVSNCYPDTEKCLGLFTDKLAKRYSKLQNKVVKQEYLDVLINRYLKRFDIHIFRSFDLEEVIKRVKTWGKNFTQVKIGPYMRLKQDHLEALASATPNVESWVLTGKSCRDSHLKEIAKHCKMLKSLILCDGWISIEGLKHFLRHPDGSIQPNESLTHLNIMGTPIITKKDVKFCVANFCSLKYLDHFYMADVLCEMMPKTFLPLQRLYLFQHVDKEVASYSHLWRSVESLSLYVYQQNIKEIFKFENLKDLTLYARNDVVLDADNFLHSHGSQLVMLKVENVVISLDVLLEYCPMLEQLSIANAQFKKCSVTDLGFTHLKVVNIDSQPQNEEAICYILWNSPNLKKIVLRWMNGLQQENYISFLKQNASVADILLQRAPDIVKLELQFTELTAAFLEQFLRHAVQLEYIGLYDMEDHITFVEYLHLKEICKAKCFLTVNAFHNEEPCLADEAAETSDSDDDGVV